MTIQSFAIIFQSFNVICVVFCWLSLSSLIVLRSASFVCVGVWCVFDGCECLRAACCEHEVTGVLCVAEFRSPSHVTGLNRSASLSWHRESRLGVHQRQQTVSSITAPLHSMVPDLMCGPSLTCSMWRMLCPSTQFQSGLHTSVWCLLLCVCVHGVVCVCVCVHGVCVCGCVHGVCGVCSRCVCVCVFTVCVCVCHGVCVCVHLGWVKCRAQIASMDHHTWPHITFTNTHIKYILRKYLHVHIYIIYLITNTTYFFLKYYIHACVYLYT